VPQIIHWLNQNSGAVTASATVAGVLVAIAYSIFAALQWRATKQQADITRSAFEASHRPYLVIEVREPTDATVHGRLSFRIIVRNEGTVPADITGWNLAAKMRDLDGHQQPVAAVEPFQSPVGRTLAPRQSGAVEVEFVDPALPNPTLPFTVSGSVDYCGVARSTYRTEFNAQRSGDGWNATGYTMT